MYKITVWTFFGKLPITIDASAGTLVSLTMSKDMESVGTWQAEFVPTAISGKTWFDVFTPFSMVEIRKVVRTSGVTPPGGKSILKMRGYVTWVGQQANAATGAVRYTVKGYDMGLFFTKYFCLLTNKYIQGVNGSPGGLANAYKEELTKLKNAAKMTIYTMLPQLFKVFTELYQKSVYGPLSPFSYRFMDGETIADKWGVDGRDLFVWQEGAVRFAYPVYVNLFKEGQITFWEMVQGWVTEHHNDMWMDTTDGQTPYSVGEPYHKDVVPTEGFKLFIRPTTKLPARFEASAMKIIKREKVLASVASKSGEDQFSIFLAVAQGAYNIGGSFSLGIPVTNKFANNIVGNRLFQGTIKNVYSGEEKTKTAAQLADFDPRIPDLVQSSKDLEAIYGLNHALLAGQLTCLDVDVRVGEKIMTEVYEGPGRWAKLTALVHSVQESISFGDDGAPAPTVTIGYHWGVKEFSPLDAFKG